MNSTKEIYRKIYTDVINSLKEDPYFRSKLTKEQIEFIEMVFLVELASSVRGKQHDS